MSEPLYLRWSDTQSEAVCQRGVSTEAGVIWGFVFEKMNFNFRRIPFERKIHDPERSVCYFTAGRRRSCSQRHTHMIDTRAKCCKHQSQCDPS